ncbi:hypothetical protein EYC84_005981 [Monilinia fructicola]|uniref:Uncharacterized protein n=1 Tax=Monilinia fructicola TaxID=38448 RepID=A0A5M9K0X3_MONFR|nr:hypothetical protein EYC84_005981 [Monilinia fructicola]
MILVGRRGTAFPRIPFASLLSLPLHLQRITKNHHHHHHQQQQTTTNSTCAESSSPLISPSLSAPQPFDTSYGMGFRGTNSRWDQSGHKPTVKMSVLYDESAVCILLFPFPSLFPSMAPSPFRLRVRVMKARDQYVRVVEIRRKVDSPPPAHRNYYTS